jgi:hypothetical protein
MYLCMYVCMYICMHACCVSMCSNRLFPRRWLSRKPTITPIVVTMARTASVRNYTGYTTPNTPSPSRRRPFSRTAPSTAPKTVPRRPHTRHFHYRAGRPCALAAENPEVVKVPRPAKTSPSSLPAHSTAATTPSPVCGSPSLQGGCSVSSWVRPRGPSSPAGELTRRRSRLPPHRTARNSCDVVERFRDFCRVSVDTGLKDVLCRRCWQRRKSLPVVIMKFMRHWQAFCGMRFVGYRNIKWTFHLAK